MRCVCYKRVSTANQELENQTDSIEKQIELFGWNKVGEYSEVISGMKSRDTRPQLRKLLADARKRKFDRVIVFELSRLGRNTIDTLTTLKSFEEKGINVVVRGMGNLQSLVNGKKNPIWNLITSVMSSLYELERENILERTEMGRKMYVMNGGKLGRKVGTVESRDSFLQKDRTKKIFNLLEKGKSVRDISGRLGVSTKTVVKVRKYWDKPRKEYVEGLENQPVVSSMEFVDLMLWEEN